MKSYRGLQNTVRAVREFIFEIKRMILLLIYEESKPHYSLGEISAQRNGSTLRKLLKTVYSK